MEKEMKALYIEGIAIHDGPESCIDVRKGGGEALTGVHAGRAIEPRNNHSQGADAVSESGRQHRRMRHRKCATDPARSKNLCMHGVSMRENREVPSFHPTTKTKKHRRVAQKRQRPYC
jgi:hypothetical protein